MDIKRLAQKAGIAITVKIKQIIDELRKVVTPTSKELFFWALAVFIFVLFLMALVTGMDFGLGKLTLWIFG
ncbi:MAG: preprotein translocase subunit SecE [Bifidobacterium dentium]